MNSANPKTGTKSCTAALRKLTYNVADYPETLEFLGETWLDFMNGKTDIAAVIEKYKELGFNVNQDFPGNFLWEEIYQVKLIEKLLKGSPDQSFYFQKQCRQESDPLYYIIYITTLNLNMIFNFRVVVCRICFFLRFISKMK